MPEHELSFTAEDVFAEGSDEFGYAIYTIAFRTGDPEADGHSWSFSRSFEDDWGVCTVREIQQATLYDGITDFSLSRTGIDCKFDTTSSEETGFSVLRIRFEINTETWEQLAATADVVFRDKRYYRRSNA